MEDKREILDLLEAWRLGMLVEHGRNLRRERVLKGTLEELGRDWRTEEFVIMNTAIV